MEVFLEAYEAKDSSNETLAEVKLTKKTSKIRVRVASGIEQLWGSWR